MAKGKLKGRSAKVGAFALVTDGERLLLVKQAYGKRLWALPGGLSEPGEELAETARREVVEETGLDVAVGDLVAVADRGFIVLFVFAASYPGGEPAPQDAEIEALGWFTAEELEGLTDQAYGLARELGLAWLRGGAGKPGLRGGPIAGPDGRYPLLRV
ncbi:NUDIX hydrolase [Flindersiella endophytica]